MVVVVVVVVVRVGGRERERERENGVNESAARATWARALELLCRVARAWMCVRAASRGATPLLSCELRLL